MFRSGSSLKVDANESWKKIIDTPRAYELTPSSEPNAEQKAEAEVSFYVLGCAGDLALAQKQVADLMNKIAGAKKKPLAVFLMGDNFYHDKLKAFNDAAFNINFYDVYHHPKNHALKGIPFFVILGNHDHGLSFFWRNGGGVDHNVVGMQVMHTYIDERGEVSPKKVALYSGASLALDTLQKWNMPSRYYVLRYENIEFFLIDSSTYVKDYLAALKDPNDLSNQVNWLKREYAVHPGRMKLLFSHHPLVTMGKRFFYGADSWDTKSYVTASEIQTLKALGVDGSYSAMLRQILKRQNMVFDSVFAAHDHAICYYNARSEEERLCQVIAGGGGGPLQSRKSHHEWERVPTFLNEHGFVEVTIAPRSLDKKIEFNFYGIHGAHLRFDNLQLSAVKDISETELGVKMLRQIVLAAYEKYVNHLLARQNGKSGILDFFEKFRHRQDGVDRVLRLSLSPASLTLKQDDAVSSPLSIKEDVTVSPSSFLRGDTVAPLQEDAAVSSSSLKVDVTVSSLSSLKVGEVAGSLSPLNEDTAVGSSSRKEDVAVNSLSSLKVDEVASSLSPLGKGSSASASSPFRVTQLLTETKLDSGSLISAETRIESSINSSSSAGYAFGLLDGLMPGVSQLVTSSVTPPAVELPQDAPARAATSAP
ncbi:MAG: metallophosphoesterase [Gammaproteobacteria bacterium]|nr:metallophosphoesterase [Gammaproteobacteria bacterium]